MSSLRVGAGLIVGCAALAALAACALPVTAAAQSDTIVVTGSVVFRTSKTPVVGRAIWTRELADPPPYDLGSEPGYRASRKPVRTDSTGAFQLTLVVHRRAEPHHFALGAGIGTTLEKAGGGAATLTIQGTAHPVALGVLEMPEIEGAVPVKGQECDSLLAGRSTATTGSGEFVVLIKRPFEFEQEFWGSSKEKKQRRLADTQIAPWEFDAAIQRRIEARVGDRPGRLVCILEDKLDVGRYTGFPGRPSWAAAVVGYQTVWDVRLRTETGTVEKTRLQEDPTQPNVLSPSVLAEVLAWRMRPDQELRVLPEQLGNWIVKKNGSRE